MAGKDGVNFSGRWSLTSTENYPEWLVAMGIAEADCRKYLAHHPSLEIAHHGDTIVYVSRKGDEVTRATRRMGEAFLDTAHGMNGMRVARWDGNRLVISAYNNPPGQWTTTCELIGDQLLMCYISHKRGKDDVTARRWFSRVGDPDPNV